MRNLSLYATTFSAFALTANGVAVAQETESKNAPIIVTGNRAEQAEVTADLAKSITLDPPADQPLAKFYQPLCVKVFGLEADYAEVLAERILDNARALKLAVGGRNCQPNSWVGFVTDSYRAVEQLREEEPAMFFLLHDYEIDRILKQSKAAQAWHAQEVKGIDGKPLIYAKIKLGNGEVNAPVNTKLQPSRVISPIRVDMNGAIVLFDRRLSAGRTIRQLADYATFRILAPVKDLPQAGTEQPQTILSLFGDDGSPPKGLTEFDWTYLSALYSLRAGSKVEKMHDAAKSAFLRGVGQDLLAKSETKVPE